MSGIRITLERRSYLAWNGRIVESQTVVKEFDDRMEAATWFVEDSYFGEDYTTKATWEEVA